MATKNKKGGSRKTCRATQKQTFVAIVVDRSASMSGKEDAAVNGVNEQLNALKVAAEKGGTTKVALIRFDSEIETLYSGVNAKHVEPFTRAQYQPRGSTSLRDATVEAIKTLKAMCEKETKDTGFLVIVVSDGEENSSKTPVNVLAAQIKELQDTKKWTFTYMLSNTDLSKFQKDYGVIYANMASFNASDAWGVSRGFATSAGATLNYMSMRESGITNSSNFYAGDTSNDNTTVPQPNTVVIPSQDVNVTIKGVDSGGGIFGPKKPQPVTPKITH